MAESPVALVTGGSRGIGAAVARRLLDRGHRVAVTGRDPEHLKRLAADLGDPDDLLTLAGHADWDAVRAQTLVSPTPPPSARSAHVRRW